MCLVFFKHMMRRHKSTFLFSLYLRNFNFKSVMFDSSDFDFVLWFLLLVTLL